MVLMTALAQLIFFFYILFFRTWLETSKYIQISKKPPIPGEYHAYLHALYHPGQMVLVVGPIEFNLSLSLSLSLSLVKTENKYK